MIGYFLVSSRLVGLYIKPYRSVTPSRPLTVNGTGGFHPADSGWDEIDRIFEAMSQAPEQSFAGFIGGIRAAEEALRAADIYVGVTPAKK